MQKILEQIAVTAELMGTQISPAAAAMMVKDLQGYDANIVIEALSCLRKDAKARFSIGAIIDKAESLTPGGRPSPEEAWAMIPKDEKTSAVITNEMAQALGVAQPLIDDGDNIAARMAFKEAYSNIVSFNKQHGIKAEWFPSLGHDKEGRDSALAEAVRLGRLGADHAIGLLPPEKVAPMLQSAGKETLALEYKMPNEEKARANLVKLKSMLANSKMNWKNDE
jgi:hypothetical protein